MNAAIDRFQENPNNTSMLSVVQDAVGDGLGDEDVARLASILGQSGDFQPVRLGRPTVDLASTGGPSSLSTLLGPLFLCSMNCHVPKLGVPGRPAGGVDTLAQIPAYNINLTSWDVLNCIQQCGYAHFLANEGHAPLDARLFRFRQSVGAQSVPALAIASILAKKVAVGVQRSGLDIRVAPHGNFGSTWEEARKNGHRFLTVATLLGIEAVCVLTDATVPYQRFLGRGESLLALRHLFEGTTDSTLWDHATQCLAMAKAAAGTGVDHTGTFLEDLSRHFFNNLCAQGSSRDAFEEYASRVERSHKFCLSAVNDGFVHIDLEQLRDVIVHYQRLGSTTGSAFPDEMGVVLVRMPGDLVQCGDLLATVRIAEMQWQTAQSRLSEAIEVRPKLARGRGYEEVENG